VNEEIFEVKIKKREINLIIWLIPIISLIVAGWLVYKYYSSLGPLITIYFKNSGGLEPKRSVVKFRDVVVGEVEDVKILKNSDGVLVYVRMHKDIKPFLNHTTKFWIVKPKIGLNQIRGLDALISGPYIQMYALATGFKKEKFVGLNEPPLDSDVLNGKIFTLIADSTYGLSEKLPVYFKHLQVGTIRKIKLTKNAKVKIIVSINRNYVRFINDSTKFWNVKKVDISLFKNYLQISFPTLKELIFGGIVFATPENRNLTKTTFKLYPSKAAAFANSLGKFVKYKEFIVEFTNKNSSLHVGEVVKFKGFDVGFVKKIESVFDIDKGKIISYVTLNINIGAFMKNKNEKIVDKLLKKGISVSIKEKIPFINISYLDLSFTNKAYKKEIIDGKIRLKVVYKKENTIADKLSKFLDKLNSLPLKKSVNDLDNLLNTITLELNNTLLSITKTSNSIRSLIKSKKVNSLIINTNDLIKNLNKIAKTYSNKYFYKKVSKTLYDIDKTVNNLNRVLIKIDKKPNSIILGD